jgi:type I restriction enzyme S subunit
VADGKISFDDLKWCELSEREISSLMLERGDILFIRTNGVRERVGSCAVYHGQLNHALFASYLIRARLKTNELMPEFFYYFSRTSAGVSQLAGRSSSSADGKFNINTKIIDSVLVPTPTSLDEQKEIADILQTLDGKIDVHGRRQTALQAVFGALSHQLITGQTRVKDLDLKLKETVATA